MITNHLFSFCIAVLFAATSFAQNTPNYTHNELILRFHSDDVTHAVQNGIVQFGVPAVDALNEQYECTGARLVRISLPGAPRIYVLHFAAPADIPGMVEAYMHTGVFRYVEPDYKGEGAGTTATTPNDADYSTQWGLKNDGSYPFTGAKAGADIKIEEAWDIETGDSTIVVAVADAGCKMDHPDMAGRFWKNSAEVPGNGIDDDVNGFVDDVDGWNFSYNDNNVSDDHGHGTNVASIIGANSNNNIGIAGIDWHCKLMILKVLNSMNQGQTTWMNDAIAYATAKGADIINLSLQNYPFSNSTKDLVDFAYANNITVVACMGNANHGSTSYPAGYQNAIAVGATSPDDARANPFAWGGGSNYGSHISVVAPGNQVSGLAYNSNTSVTPWSGTSQATPMVAALASLLLAQDKTRTPDSLRDIIQKTADDLVGMLTEDLPGFDNHYGHGRINAFKALKYGVKPNPPGAVSGKDNSAAGIVIYPNPAKDQLYIKSSNAAAYVVLNTVGATVLSGTLNMSLNTIDISMLSSGVYMLKTVGEGSNEVNRIIIR